MNDCELHVFVSHSEYELLETCSNQNYLLIVVRPGAFQDKV